LYQVEPFLQPVRIILVTRQDTQGDECGPRLRLILRQLLERIAFERPLQLRGKLIPLFFRGEFVLLLDFRRCVLVEERLAGFVELIRRYRWRCAFR